MTPSPEYDFWFWRFPGRSSADGLPESVDTPEAVSLHAGTQAAELDDGFGVVLMPGHGGRALHSAPRHVATGALCHARANRVPVGSAVRVAHA